MTLMIKANETNAAGRAGGFNEHTRHVLLWRLDPYCIPLFTALHIKESANH